MSDKWIIWAREMQSIAQAGLTYSKDKYDIERFERIQVIAAEILSEYTKVNLETVKGLLKCEKGYLTPKVDIRAAIIKDNKILLVQEELDEKWSLPGGWADIGLSVSENAIKEAYEEAGVKIEPKKIIAVLDKDKHNKPKTFNSIYKIFVLCDFINGQYIKNIETKDSKFFGFDELPNLSEIRNNKEQIKMCFDFAKNQIKDTVFD
ncbi:MAG: NUDIX hydrolase [Sarcina sp.]